MRYKIYLLFILTSCYSCVTKSQSNTEQAPIVNIADDDAEMNQAIKKAINSFSVFEDALKKRKARIDFVSIKVPFPTADGQEHIWVSDISMENGKYFGIIDNVPESIQNVKMGDKMEIMKDKISDWMFVENKKLRGGYTLRVLRNRMSAEEKKAFDNELPFVVGDEE